MTSMLAAAVSLLATAPAVASTHASGYPKAPTGGNAPAHGLTAEQALTQSHKTGEDVKATGATTPISTLTAHPNGTFTVDESLAPERKWVKGA
ncbi:hypothetical protein [Streptomyces sp. NPDC046985]|uniref:hypothetical protein n=1 Tax=Streptomyces sp. NPDC046985 TaxID=3155377 RepID=UPI0033EFF164